MASYNRPWLLLSAIVASILTACGGGTASSKAEADTALAARPPAQTLAVSGSAVAGIQVTTLSLISETRISRTVFEYIYKVQVLNSGEAVQAAVVTLKAVGAGTSIVDGTATFVAIARGAAATSTDTISIRQDRTLPFNSGSLVWEVTATQVPPPGGVAGTDANSNGVRDDVEQYIATNYANQPAINRGLLQLAAGMQSALTASDENQREAAQSARLAAGRCLFSLAGEGVQASRLIDEVQAQQLNTADRARAELQFRSALAGKVISVPTTPASGACL